MISFVVRLELGWTFHSFAEAISGTLEWTIMRVSSGTGRCAGTDRRQLQHVARISPGDFMASPRTEFDVYCFKTFFVRYLSSSDIMPFYRL